MTGSLLPLRLRGCPPHPCMALAGDAFPHTEPEPAPPEPTLPYRVSALRPAEGGPWGWGSPTSAGREWGSVWRPDGGISADRTLGVQDKPWSGGLLAGLLLDPQAPSGGWSGPLVPPSSASLLLVSGSGLARGELGSWVPSDLWEGEAQVLRGGGSASFLRESVRCGPTLPTKAKLPVTCLPKPAVVSVADPTGPYLMASTAESAFHGGQSPSFPCS